MLMITRCALIVLLSVFAISCGTTDGALSKQGRSETYILGFHDGRHSGMKEAGNNWEHYIKDSKQFDEDAEYRKGWLDGEAEGKRLQAQARAAGEAAAGSYSGYRINQEADKSQPHPKKIAKDVMKDVNTDDLKSLEQ